MECLAIFSHYFFRAIGYHKSRSPSSPYGPALQGSQLIMLGMVGGHGRQIGHGRAEAWEGKGSRARRARID